MPAQRRRGHNLHHTNPVIEAGLVRSSDESEFQNLLQVAQFKAGIYNSEIEPEHEVDYYCGCPTHQFKRAKLARYGVQRMWSEAVKYPGESTYSDRYVSGTGGGSLFSNNPYANVTTPYGYYQSAFTTVMTPNAGSHASFIRETLALNARLNRQAQADVDRQEPTRNIWEDPSASGHGVGEKRSNEKDEKGLGDGYAWTRDESASGSNGGSKDFRGDVKENPDFVPSHNRGASSASIATPDEAKHDKRSGFRRLLGIKTAEEKQAAAEERLRNRFMKLRNDILIEEAGRWPNDEWRMIVDIYQLKTGMKKKIQHLRVHQPIQYLHLLRAGYFEPIPIAWATMNGNPLKFSIEPAGGWRGITPQWRGYEDTAEERLYWVLNHRYDPSGRPQQRMKPDFISALNMARERMARAVEPPPEYFSLSDTCYQEHKSDGYSKQVMPPPFKAYDRPEVATDDTMILLDVSGSMNFDPIKPVYNQYLVTRWVSSTQPKNKSLAKAIIRRFTEAMIHHDMSYHGYDLVTFSDRASHIGKLSHHNFEDKWGSIRIGGGTRVMTGWQKVKELHFEKHRESATHHPVYGWQAGPETPMLRLLLLLDGEATDMDEFELDLLGLDWAHVTIFLIGVDGCPHHHRHANELQRISDVNHHVAFVDAQGNTPERFVTHELLKRHLGQDISLSEFEAMEELPPYA